MHLTVYVFMPPHSLITYCLLLNGLTRVDDWCVAVVVPDIEIRFHVSNEKHCTFLSLIKHCREGRHVAPHNVSLWRGSGAGGTTVPVTMDNAPDRWLAREACVMFYSRGY